MEHYIKFNPVSSSFLPPAGFESRCWVDQNVKATTEIA